MKLLLQGIPKVKVLTKTAGIYLGTNLINSAMPFLLIPVLTHYLTPKDYGIVAMFQVLVGIIGNFTGLGVQSAIGRQYFEKESIDFPKYISSCLFIMLLSSILVSMALLAFSKIIMSVTSFPSEYLWCVLSVCIGQSLVMVVLVLWQVQGKAAVYGAFQILLTLVNMTCTLLFVIMFKMGWQGVVNAQVIAYILFSIIGITILFKDRMISLSYVNDYVRHAIKYSIPLIPHNIGAWVMCMMDRVMITNMVGLADTGVYAVGAQIGMGIALIQNSFNQAWTPWLFGQLKEDKISIKLVIVKITYLYDFLLLILALLLAAVAPWFIDHFVGKAFAGANKYVIWIALGYAFNGMYKMVANYIFYTGHTYVLACITFTTAVISLIIMYFLIRIYGAVGAAVGLMLSLLLSFILTSVFSARLYKMPWTLKE